MNLDPSQQAAVDLACSARFAVITGGPGTGKSTCLRVALDRMDADGESYMLASPTGKAARRMTEATGRDAQTIHRLLEWSPRGFLRDRDRPIDADVVVIDETSMLDVELGAALLRACDPSTRLIFVGDSNQLPSVGPGRMLADLVESNAVPVARLTTVHRAAEKSWICRNAPRVLAGAPLELGSFPDFRYVEADDAAAAARAVQRIVTLPEYAGAQVLTPQRPGSIGVVELNRVLQAELNPISALKAEWKIGDQILRVGDRVIQTVNNYTLNVFNGEVGTIAAFTPEAAHVDFGTADAPRIVEYSKGQATHLDLAYALTVHKCQGSEFAWVVCIVHSSHTFMLTRQLFYTAITRAKVGVILVGNDQGIRVATSAKVPPKRNTLLVERMKRAREERSHLADLDDMGSVELGYEPSEEDFA